MTHLSYNAKSKCEYAKSSTSACNLCSTNIDQGILRMAEMSEEDEVPMKKIKKEPKDEEELKEKEQAQSKLYNECRAALSKLTKKELHAFLEANEKVVPSGCEESFNHLADFMAFGVPQPCPECKNGQLVLDTFNYKCTGNINERIKCKYKMKYKPKESTRLFESETPSPQASENPPPPINIKKEEPKELVYRIVDTLLSRFPPVSSAPCRVSNTTQFPALRLQPGKHFPTHTEASTSGKAKHKQLRCVRCTALKKRVAVTTMCSLCRVPLCIGKCWEDYHTVENL